MGAYFRRLAQRSGLAEAPVPRGAVGAPPAALERDVELEEPAPAPRDASRGETDQARPRPDAGLAAPIGAMTPPPGSARALEEDEARFPGRSTTEGHAVIGAVPADTIGRDAQQARLASARGQRESRPPARALGQPVEAPAILRDRASWQEGLAREVALEKLEAKAKVESAHPLRPASAARPEEPAVSSAQPAGARLDALRAPAIPGARAVGRTAVVPGETPRRPASVEVRIGAVSVEIHQPPPAPAPAILPASRQEPRRERRAAFSPSRHYLRGD